MKAAKLLPVELRFTGDMQVFADGACYWTLPAGTRAEVDGMPSRIYGGATGRRALRLRLPNKWWKLAGRSLPVGRWRIDLLGHVTRDGFHVLTGSQPVRIERDDAPPRATRTYSPAWHGVYTRTEAVDPDLDQLERRKQRLSHRTGRRPTARRTTATYRKPRRSGPGELR